MKYENLDSFFSLEGGLYAHYRFVDGEHRLEYRARRLALAYDASTTRFERMGPPDDVMRWASGHRAQLRSEGKLEEAKHLAVVMLARDIDTNELNRVEAEPGYFLNFLQKTGLV